MNRRILLTLIIVLVAVICLVVAGIGVLIFVNIDRSTPIASIPSPTLPAAAGPLPTLPPLAQTPLPSVSTSTAAALQGADIPFRDLHLVVPRLTKNPALLTPVPTPSPRTHALGETDSFFVTVNAATGSYRTITATLQAVTPHSYFWVENGMTFDRAAIQKSADFFEQTVYPTDHKYFGSEQSPGIDGDVHIHVLTTRFEGAAGYFSSEDLYPRAFFPYSNQRNVIYMNIDVVPGSDQFDGDMAHEFQHLIHAWEAPHATGWIDEGMGDLAIKLNGFPILGVLDPFLRSPDLQLDTWAVDPRTAGAHYGASYLFFDYTAQRFGPDFTQAVIHAPKEGINGVQTVLDASEGGIRFDDLFADWAVANYLNDPSVSNGRYAYPNEPTLHISREPILGVYPITRANTLSQYAANYFSLDPAGGDVTLYFTGTTTTKLLPVDAHGGRWMWYSNRADLADTSLTRAVDLSSVDKATLNFSMWFDTEKNFDYAYVEASTDGGSTWDVLPGKYTTTDNPNGGSFGPGYTGMSGTTDAASPAQWVQDQVDLTPYAHKKISLRFEYITDDALNLAGWAIDDISIPEINFSDNVESGTNGWDAKGFIRTDNVLPQHFIVQVVEKGATTSVNRVQLDDQNRGTLTIAGFGKSVTHAELVVTAAAPTTTQKAEYEFALVPK